MRTRKVKLLKVAECISVDPIEIYKDRIEGIEMKVDEFLSMEGFEGKTFNEFVAFFEERYGLPFRGYLLVWRDVG